MNTQASINPSTPKEESTASLLTQVTNFSSFANVSLKVSKKIISSLKSYREATDKLQQQRKELKKYRDQAFSNIDSLIQAKISKMQRENPLKRKRQCSHPKLKEKQSLKIDQPLEEDQSPIFQVQGQVEDKKDKKNDKLFFAKKNKLPKQIYLCFLCIQKNNKKGAWEDQLSYVNHMREQHSFDLEFGTMIESQAKKLCCSHLFFKGTLVNLIKNYNINRKINQLYFIIKGMYSSVYICYHKKYDIPARHKDTWFSYSFYADHNDMLEHVNSCWLSKEKRSHYLREQGNRITFVRNEYFFDKYLNQVIRQSQYFLRKALSKIYFLYQRKILIKKPENILQLMSCYPDPKIISYFRGSLPLCPTCDSLLPTIRSVFKHHKQSHSTKINYVNFNSNFSYEIFMKWIKLTVYNFESLSEKEQNDAIISEQLKIINFSKRFYNIKSNYKYICGNCKNLANTPNQYIQHIYNEHRDLHPLNSHTLRFLQQKCQSSNSSDEES